LVACAQVQASMGFTAEAVILASDEDTGDSGNDLPGRMIQSFIIKIWREEQGRGKLPKWRGYITHVPTNERRYLQSLADIAEFMNSYLQRMGVRVGFVWRWKQWLKRRRTS